MADKFKHDGSLVGRFFAGIANGVSNLWNHITGNDLTDAERSANEFTAGESALARQFSHDEAQEQMRFQKRMSDTEWQRGVADMQAAGLNPALAYGQGGASAMQGAAGSPSSGSSVSPGAASSLSEIIQLAQLPAQIDLLKSQARLANSNANKTDKETSWIDDINNSRVREIASIIHVNEAKVDRMEYQNALDEARTLQVFTETKWIDRINEAKTEADKARARLDAAEAAISEFEKTKGHRLGSSELLAVATSIANWLGLGNDDFASLWKRIENYIDKASEDLKSSGQKVGPADNPAWNVDGRSYTPFSRQ